MEDPPAVGFVHIGVKFTRGWVRVGRLSPCLEVAPDDQGHIVFLPCRAKFLEDSCTCISDPLFGVDGVIAGVSVEKLEQVVKG